MRDHARHMVSVAALVAITAAAGCAPGRSVVRGTWPDGRIEGPAMTRPVPVAIAYMRPEVALETDDWLPAEATYDGLSAAELNRMGVLQPIYFTLDRADGMWGKEPDSGPVSVSKMFWILPLDSGQGDIAWPRPLTTNEQ